MTYPFNTLNASMSQGQAPRSLLGRVGQELGLLLGLSLLVISCLALWTYSPADAAWSTSGSAPGALPANWVGRFGAWLADLSYFTLGFSAWWCVAAGVWTWGKGVLRWLNGDAELPDAQRPLQPMTRFVLFWIGLLLLLSASAALEWSRLYRLEGFLPGPAGGMVGYTLGLAGMRWLGFAGSGLVCITLMVVGAGWVFRLSWARVAEAVGAVLERLFTTLRSQTEIAQDAAVGRRAARKRAADVQENRASHAVPPSEDPGLIEPVVREAVHAEPVLREPSFKEAPAAGHAMDPAPPSAPAFAPAPKAAAPVARLPDPVPAVSGVMSPRVGGAAALPQVDLLDRPSQRQETVSPETLEMTSRLIEKKLKDFGVAVTVVAATPGPVVTRYEIEPATGVKGSQIVNLAKDLARSLSLVSIRVIETIPGKNYMALELPNAKRQTIRLSEILGSQTYHDAKSLLTMGLGKDITGNPVVADLAKMPHCLVAGTTGSGKSVGINAMILSLLYKAEARDVRLLMIDPKMLEMSVYEGIPHLLCPVVTDMKQAANGLNWCVAEMERRYKLMSKLGVRNLAGYNAKIDEAAAREESIGNPFSLTPEQPEPLDRLPHIVVVIDELADLMMVVGKKIEELIARLAQKARAAGIHLILATQRPSVDVITGLIKANIPTRIAFSVGSKIDSRTILDQMGAEALLGMGDMLYMASGTGFPVRVHGAFVSDEEVHRVVSYLKAQGEPDYIDGVLEGAPADGDDGPLGEDGGGSGEKDPMYDQAVEVVLKDRKASISYVQRKLRIGYNRSARLLEDMEKAGLVSALTASGQREVLVPNREA